MQPCRRTANIVALALMVAVCGPLGFGLGNGTAAAQWLISPPLDSPPAPQRPPEGYGRQIPQAAPGETNAAPQGDQEGEGNAAAPPAGCPYNERKLELLV